MKPLALPLWQRRSAGPAAIAAVFIAMLIWTWQTWADLLVDYGVQLYVPWQLTQGKVLYRDIAHYTGPLSIYYCALAMRIFGTNLRVVEFANLPILIGTVAAIYYLANRLSGRLCATICGISFLILFAFAHLTIAGNYNYVCPYEYEYTHATLLGLICLIFLARLIRTGRMISAAIAGFLTGLIFLTRTEFFVAIIGATAIGMLLLATTMRLARVATACAIFVVAGLIPPVISAALLHLAMPWSTAIHGVLGMWPAILRGNVASQHFYQHSIGLDDLNKSLFLLAVWCGIYAIALAGFFIWAALTKSKPVLPQLIAAFLAGILFAGWRWQQHDWISLFRPLPVIAACVIVISIHQFWRRRHQPEARSTAALAAMLAFFALLLLGKVFLYARIIHYGCWLAMPAAMILLIALFGWIPEFLRRRCAGHAICFTGISGAWIVVLFVYLAMTGAAMKTLTVPTDSGPDRFWADATRGNIVNSAILAAQQIPAGKTLDCFPEGIMINYLARRQTAGPYVNFNPPDLLLFGEDRMLDAIRKTQPDYIFLVHKDTSEFGERFFGVNYGQKLYAWIVQNYQEQPLPMLDLGAEPLRNSQFGIRLLIPRTPPDQRRLTYGPGTAPALHSSAAASISSAE
jgi:hypothetical protein